ncbi:Ppx/GppA phosphatase family protein [Pedobacter cryoconitis]|uniref:Exopolyphosphatase/guanosine-5'-triphosphate, 3'-diphosphate pyrophosphatase n=1 Tax=Pedobacter cryoconitis TaxID=188932 RepID=A0A327T1M5_9SPHI|nr:exopolyphosphatase [Pedobacter cryoconitis]RAJ31687.1 exopolyphosphatase/guanosine-5'-triphosphate,3'-diphosphate pyrophosphatase [Pedobacter cryoconitis]
MKAAVIDLGTNTFHLIIADLTPLGVEVVYKTNLPVQLGQGRINENLIIPEAFERGIEALRGFKKEIDAQQVTIVRATATSAVRSAGNGKDFVIAALKIAGIAIEVISGEDEAAYIFNGVKATGVIQQQSLIMDIGGGSTEFIICNQDGPLWKKSYNIGAARLLQAYFHTDPISSKDQTAIQAHLDLELADLLAACQKYEPQVLVGSAGAFETFAAMLLEDVDLKTISSASFDIAQYHSLAERLIASSHAERALMPNLIPLRVDMIVIAAILTNYVLDKTGVKAISLSTYDLKMGVLYKIWADQKFESSK